MKKTTLILSSLFAMAFFSNAMAIGSEELLVRQLNAKSASAVVIPSAASLINIYYSGGSDNEINISSGMLNLEAPVDTVVANYNLGHASYDTIGELCDAINTNDGWTCLMTGGKRDDLSVLTWQVAAQAVNTAGGYNVLIGTGAVLADETIRYVNRLGITPAAGKRVSLKYCTYKEDGTNTLAIYGKLAKFETATDGVTRNDTTLVASFPTTAADTEYNKGNLYNGTGWDFAKDEHVVISAGNGTTSQVDTTSFIFCNWEEK